MIFQKLSKKWIFGQFWGQFFPLEVPKSSWFRWKCLWSTWKGPSILFSLVLSHILPKYCLLWRNWDKKQFLATFWTRNAQFLGPIWLFEFSSKTLSLWSTLIAYFMCSNCIFTTNGHIFWLDYHFLVIFDKIWTRLGPKINKGPPTRCSNTN